MEEYSHCQGMETNTFIIGVNGTGNSTYIEGTFGGNSFITGPLGVIREFKDYEDQDIIVIHLEEIELVKEFLASVI